MEDGCMLSGRFLVKCYSETVLFIFGMLTGVYGINGVGFYKGICWYEAAVTDVSKPRLEYGSLSIYDKSRFLCLSILFYFYSNRN